MRILTEDTRVGDGVLTAHLQTLAPYRNVLRAAIEDRACASHEASLALPFDEAGRAQANEIARAMGGQVRTVVLVGIGGSDLGTRAVIDALVGYADALVQAHPRRLVAFDTVEPTRLARFDALLDTHAGPEQLVFVVVSKSGTTSETIAIANILQHKLQARWGDAVAPRTVVIGDGGTELARTASAHGMRHVAMPHLVGGRFSVFSVVGLVPLALMGVDIDAVCDGARSATHAGVPAEGYGPAAVLAATLFEAYLNGRALHELFLFHPQLETLGKWYRQLLAESIGKEREDGTRVGIMPTVAIGSTDLHSLGQLVFGGPNDRTTTFVAAPSLWNATDSCDEHSPFTLSALKGKHVGEVMQAIYGGARAAYRKHQLSHLVIELDGITPRELGAFMALQMASIMYLGKLFDVNAFDQPAVESYKLEARRLLTQTG